MYIALETINIWEIESDIEPAAFFRTLPLVCSSHDILVIGSYDIAPEIIPRLTAHEISLSDHRKPFGDSFDFNRTEYPRGRAYSFHPTLELLENLAALCEIKNGGVEKDLFFDHALIYRPGPPVFPLLNFHDAFVGPLCLSGLYPKEEISVFTAALNASAKSIINPALPSEVVALLTR